MAVAGLRTVLQARFTAVLCAHVIAAPVAWLVARVAGVPYVVWVYADELVSPWRFWRWALKAADRVIAISGHSRALAIKAGADPERTVIVPCGADVPSLDGPPPSRDRDAIEGRVVLTVSRMDDLYKGHDVMLRSLPMVASQVPDVRYVMVGDGRYATYYRRLAEALGIGEHVVFAGRATETLRDWWYRRCDVFVMLSRVSLLDGGGEGFGIAFLEASAWEKPVIAGAAGGSVDAVADGTSGLLVTADDAREVADALIRLLGDAELARCLGRQGRKRVEERFSWPVISREIEDAVLGTWRRRASAVSPAGGR
jgi:glycosyltransferase involved in cell wall biosynthesis